MVKTAEEVIIIDIAQEKAVAAFSNRLAFDAMIADVRKAAVALIPENPDMTKKKDRDAVRSLAAKVPKLKTKVDAWGASLVDESRKAVNEMDALRKEFRQELDDLKDEIRKPLTDWEVAEEARVEKIQAEINKARDLGQVKFGETSKQIQDRIDQLPTHDLDFYEEFKDEAQLVLEAAFNQLTAARTAAKNVEDELAQREAERQELADLKALQDKKEREAEAQANILRISNIGHGILDGEKADTATLISELKAMKITSAYGDLVDDANRAWTTAFERLQERKEEEAQKQADEQARLAADAEKDAQIERQRLAFEQSALDAQNLIKAASAETAKEPDGETPAAVEVVHGEQNDSATISPNVAAYSDEYHDRAMSEAQDDVAATLEGLTRAAAPLAIVQAAINGSIRHIRFEA